MNIDQAGWCALAAALLLVELLAIVVLRRLVRTQHNLRDSDTIKVFLAEELNPVVGGAFLVSLGAGAASGVVVGNKLHLQSWGWTLGVVAVSLGLFTIFAGPHSYAARDAKD